MFKLTKGIISLKIEVLSLNNNTLYKTQKGKKLHVMRLQFFLFKKIIWLTEYVW